jgi:hypothetical protein
VIESQIIGKPFVDNGRDDKVRHALSDGWSGKVVRLRG